MIIDVDALFEKFLRKFMKDNAGKYTEEQWEDKMPELYAQFGNSPLKELDGKSPAEYYSALSAEKLVELLEEHIYSNVSVSDFLCDAITANKNTEEHLCRLIDKETDEELLSYAVNMLEELNSSMPLNKYLDFLSDSDVCADVKELLAEILAEHAFEITDRVLKLYETEGEDVRKYLVEILVKGRKCDETLAVLLKEFAENPDKIPQYCQYLASYGDEKALPALLEAIEREDINYLDFTELKYAIETLGGEYEKERNFDNDRYYKKIKEKI